MKNVKQCSKPLFILALSLWVLAFNAPHAFAQDDGLREEVSTLEALYQEKAKEILNNLVDEKEYTIVVTAKIRNDPEKLKEYQDAIEKKFLPGLIITDPMGYGTEHNLLHELKQKVEIQVVLADSVPADRESIIKDILRSKLHLNEETGDVITIKRAVQAPVRELASDTPKKLPELSARMIAFWIIMGILVTAALLVWLHKRKEKQRAKTLELEEPQEQKNQTDANENSFIEQPKTEEELERERDALEMKVAFAKGELIKLVKENPSIVCKAAEEYFSQGKISETTTYLESLGWENSKKLFKELDLRLWSRIGANLRERTNDPTLEEVFQSVHQFHRFALSYVLAQSGKDSDNPFSFLFRLTDSQRKDLLTNENSFNVALISIYCSGPQMGELLSGLSSTKQHEVLHNITKIKHLSESQVHQSVQRFLMHLEHIKAHPTIHAEGTILAADFMRNLDPAREETLYQMLLAEHPFEAERLRRVQVTFSDIPYYPADLVRGVLDTLEHDEITKSLVGFPGEFVETFLSLLPTKKALMIQNDLFHMEIIPTHSQCAEYRRKICTKLESAFEQQRFNLTEFWEQTSPEENTEIINAQDLQRMAAEAVPVTRSEPAVKSQPVAVEQPDERTRVLTQDELDSLDVFPDDDSQHGNNNGSNNGEAA